ncbi:DUF4838 domain-containing protein [Flavobacterium litorale]|uniref:DUF4838 domain-containing protein n=1 Tax=Flavobacterium litorale TaxID=2856519 RepID=A0ABX8V694_9FLAO|nr:DUF4838 domain-containing protein [Flavobacterium litorale]QYJ68012.1 DUF4838 domain-containing protein [Flavobacterium litorale]
MLVSITFGNAQTFTVCKSGEIMPVVTVTDEALHPLAEDLCDFFEQTVGKRPIITNNPNNNKVTIVLDWLPSNNTNKNSLFTITHKENTLTIKAATKQGFYNANRYFFSTYTGVNQFSLPKKLIRVTEIKVPVNLNYKHVTDFEYREPYFPDNFDKNFRRWNITHTLEDVWGIWGHNIGKVIPVTPAMYAIVDGEKYEEQFCFSSPELEKALKKFINGSVTENPTKSKFMVMPNDNAVVCQCNRCKALGTTKSNASPAVFTLLNKLATHFPKQDFFSTAYITTQQPPAFKLADNAGVMISTMAFPKGFVVANSNKAEKIRNTFTSWQNITNKIYLWDYAVNFDNYFEIYPTVSIAQQNLQFYKSLGVTGVFMQGSEDRYSAFADLKCYVYAKLLQNVMVDVDKEIAFFFNNNYPSTVSKLLYGYYSKAEELSLASKKSMDIYGGTAPAKKKYLNESDFSSFYNALVASVNKLSVSERKKIQPLLLAITFQQLELLRTSPSQNDTGYGIVENNVATIKPDVIKLLQRLKQLHAATGIDIYNESGFTLSEYINYWDTEIINTTYENLLFGKAVEVKSELDEDYTDIGRLTDGAIAFNDYYNNWLLFTVSPMVTIEVRAKDVKDAELVTMNFLNDTKHNIYLPESVLITINGREYKTKIDKTDAVKYKAAVPIILLPEDKTIVITVAKQEAYKNKSIACDELFFN